MSPVGSYLHALRRKRGVSLEEIARATRVAHRYLEALESDDLAVLPAPVFTRGFIRAYCQALGVAPEEALARYAERTGPGGAAEVRGGPLVAEAGETARRGRGAVLVSFVLLVVLGLALFATTLVLQSEREGPGRPRASALATRSAPLEPREPAPALPVPPPAPAVRPEPPPTPITLAPPSPTPAGAAAIAEALRSIIGTVATPYRLVARTSEQTWLRVRTDDGRVSEENIPAGQSREWVSNRPFVLTIGNAGGIALELNGRPLPRLGASGAVINGLVLPPP